jgi:UDP-glucose 4-epimerase
MSDHDHGSPRSVLVTGATGFVGRHLCRSLATHGWTVVAAARSGANNAHPPGVATAQLDLLVEPEKWQTALHHCDCVVHLAAAVHRFGSDKLLESEFDRINVDGSRFVAQQAIRAGVRQFIFLSSVKVNGEGRDRPYQCSDLPDPKDAYGRSKLAAEECLRSLCMGSATALAIIRPPLVYGPGVKANFHKLMRLADSGIPLPFAFIENRRSLIGVGNLVHFIETCMSNPDASDQAWLVSDGEDLSTPDLVSRLARLMHRPIRMFGLSPNWMRRLAGPFPLRGMIDRLCASLQVDSSAAHRSLGWNPPFSVDEQLASTVAAYIIERK